MIWLYALLGAYLGLMPIMWFGLYSDLRDTRSRFGAWRVASLLALVWLPWVVQFRVWNRHRRHAQVAQLKAQDQTGPPSVADEAEQFLSAY